jgi:hypothetical protein
MKPRIPKQPEITLISPEGKLVRRSAYFECPEVIIIGDNGVSFDGWVFRTDADISESDIRWLGHQLEIIQAMQGLERAGALMAALEKLISTPRGTNAGESWPERRGELPGTGQVPFCISPDGSPVNAVEELPDLPLPKKVIVGREFMLVDGWNFRIWPITKPHLEWLVRQACRWLEEDPSPENKVQISGVVEAMEARIKNGDATGVVSQPRAAI